ncbi:hypothetical protein C2G38_2110039 [Gigaspora rosea]|uniref:Uncharacterized protein n=1 Tax=Gigaspora rosea TaxID=44941 RepID=A0A397UJA8_9GLOM|nr:hypothetical protein C2G38_2110039 [Gigaspora rosea]
MSFIECNENIYSMRSNANLQSQLWWVTTISETIPLLDHSSKVLSPFLLKLIPNPTSLTSS